MRMDTADTEPTLLEGRACALWRTIASTSKAAEHRRRQLAGGSAAGVLVEARGEALVAARLDRIAIWVERHARRSAERRRGWRFLHMHM